MNEPAPQAPAGRRIGAQPSWILLGLILGLAIGGGAAAFGTVGAERLVGGAALVGGLWLDGLRMTIIPLVFALVVSGMASAARTLRGGGVAARALATFAALLLGSATVTALVALPAIAWWSPEAIGAAGQAVPALPGPAATLRAFVPTNVVAAAANDAIVPLVLFALLLGLAISRISDARRAVLTDLFAGLADAMLVIVGWVLALAPIGVFALALAAVARLGVDAGTALAFYIALQIVLALILIGLMYLLVGAAGRTSPLRFGRAALPAQAVAFSTQSSLASLPAMIAGAERLGLPGRVSGVVLPLAVATFKISAPLVALTVALTLASLAGVAVEPWRLAAGILLAAVSTLAVVGLPGQVSFFAANAPTALAVGAPIELLPLFLAIDTIPDMIRTVANVTADLAVTVLVAAGEGTDR